MKITETQFRDYVIACNFTRSYKVEDWVKSGLAINEFMFIADHYDELNRKYRGGR